MISIIANVFYVLIAVAMIVLILLQRGAGAAAGSGFGGGASATVFGARGSANFLSRSTAVLAALFFLLSLGMGIYLGRSGTSPTPTDDLGVMSGAAAPKEKPAPAYRSSGGERRRAAADRGAVRFGRQARGAACRRLRPTSRRPMRASPRPTSRKTTGRTESNLKPRWRNW